MNNFPINSTTVVELADASSLTLTRSLGLCISDTFKVLAVRNPKQFFVSTPLLE